MEKKIIFGFLAVFVLGVLIGFFFGGRGITGKAVFEEENLSRNYGWTTAVCDDDTHECIDIFVNCSQGRVVSIKPVSSLMYLGKNWSDIRDSSVEYCR